MRTRHFQARESQSKQLTSLENLASKTKLTKLLKSTRSALRHSARSSESALEDGLASSRAIVAVGGRRESWWSQPGSNRRPSGCKPDALPAELWPLVCWRKSPRRFSRDPTRLPRAQGTALGPLCRGDTGGSGRSCTSDLTLIRGAL